MASGPEERILSDDHIGEEQREAECPESISSTTPDVATLAELLTAFKTLRREAASPTALPIRPHATRLPSRDRAVSLLFLATVHHFYGTHGGLQLSMERVCNKDGPSECVSVRTLTASTGLSLAESAAHVRSPQKGRVAKEEALKLDALQQPTHTARHRPKSISSWMKAWNPGLPREYAHGVWNVLIDENPKKDALNVHQQDDEQMPSTEKDALSVHR